MFLRCSSYVEEKGAMVGWKRPYTDAALAWVSQTTQPLRINEGITLPLESMACKERQSERRNNTPP